MKKEVRCWICKRTNAEIAQELNALKSKGVWLFGVPESKARDNLSHLTNHTEEKT